MRYSMLKAAVVAVVAFGLMAGQALAASPVASSNVAVIPGFQAPRYPGTAGVPPFPNGAAALSGFQFGQLAAGAITPAALQPYDTIVLYGLRWSTLSASAQAAINTFALTGKVLIWDADATGSQSYAGFVHPFTTTASGEVDRSSNGSVVTFPSGSNPIASSNPGSPLYLDPAALVASTHLVQDMSVMNPGATDWSPGLIAANTVLPSGGWILSWAYGSTVDHSGMAIYSGMDADAFSDPVTPNYAIKELAIELGAPFLRAVDTSCSPGCSAPPAPGGGGGGGQSGLGGSNSPTFAQCTLKPRPSVGWVHGHVTLSVKMSVATGVRGQVVTQSGKVIGTATPSSPGQLDLPVNTRLLPSNRATKLRAIISVNAATACTLTATLKVDNIPPRLLVERLAHSGSKWLLTVKASEAVRFTVVSKGKSVRKVNLRARKPVTLVLASKPLNGRYVLVDRSRNQVSHRLH